MHHGVTTATQGHVSRSPAAAMMRAGQPVDLATGRASCSNLYFLPDYLQSGQDEQQLYPPGSWLGQSQPRWLPGHWAGSGRSSPLPGRRCQWQSLWGPLAWCDACMVSVERSSIRKVCWVVAGDKHLHRLARCESRDAHGEVAAGCSRRWWHIARLGSKSSITGHSHPSLKAAWVIRSIIPSPDEAGTQLSSSKGWQGNGPLLLHRQGPPASLPAANLLIQRHFTAWSHTITTGPALQAVLASTSRCFTSRLLYLKQPSCMTCKPKASGASPSTTPAHLKAAACTTFAAKSGPG